MRVLIIVSGVFVLSVTVLGFVRVLGPGWTTKVTPLLETLSFDAVRHPELYARAERLFNRHFPFREGLRRSKALIDYHVFRSSPIPDVYVGLDGWLSYRDELPDFAKDGCGKTQAMGALARELHELEELVGASGRTFVFTVAPNKSTIYPEYVGLSRSAICGASGYELLLKAFEDSPVRRFVRLDGRLLEAKATRQVYYKTDTHWNDEGALLVARALLEYLVPHAWQGYIGQVERTTVAHTGDLVRLMGLPVRESAPRIRSSSKDATWTERRIPEAGNIRHTVVRRNTASDPPILPRAVFYSDSFMIAPLEMMGGAFDQVDIYWLDQTPTMAITAAGSEDALSASRVVVFEVVERVLDRLVIDVQSFASALKD